MEALSFDHLVATAVSRCVAQEGRDTALAELRRGLEENPGWVEEARDRLAFYGDDRFTSGFAKTAISLLREVLQNLPEAACLTPAN